MTDEQNTQDEQVEGHAVKIKGGAADTPADVEGHPRRYGPDTTDPADVEGHGANFHGEPAQDVEGHPARRGPEADPADVEGHTMRVKCESSDTPADA